MARKSGRSSRSRKPARSTRAVKASRKNIRPGKNKHLLITTHDEDKLLLFTSGVLLGVGLSLSIFLSQWWYGGLVAIALGVVLLLVEKRQY